MSLQKIAVFIAVLGAVWAIYRVVRSFNGSNRVGRADNRSSRARDATQDMRECPVCGTYVAPAVALDCGRGRCPYPRASA
ncbi:MAG: hypothetical protein FJX36_15965 [Alphaproteobacteria bacterium]|nr:hypothetical protein [Alphaproteobacteria bacterium]